MVSKGLRKKPSKPASTISASRADTGRRQLCIVPVGDLQAGGGVPDESGHRFSPGPHLRHALELRRGRAFSARMDAPGRGPIPLGARASKTAVALFSRNRRLMRVPDRRRTAPAVGFRRGCSDRRPGRRPLIYASLNGGRCSKILARRQHPGGFRQPPLRDWDVPGRPRSSSATPPSVLPAGMPGTAAARRFGDQWLSELRSAILLVPQPRWCSLEWNARHVHPIPAHASTLSGAERVVWDRTAAVFKVSREILPLPDSPTRSVVAFRCRHQNGAKSNQTTPTTIRGYLPHPLLRSSFSTAPFGQDVRWMLNLLIAARAMYAMRVPSQCSGASNALRLFGQQQGHELVSYPCQPIQEE